MTQETYLDHAATTPIRAEVIEAMSEAMQDAGNAASLHSAGRRARRRVEEARESVAECLGAQAIEVVFTAGGTEAANLAVKGIHSARTLADPDRRTLLTSPAEHHAVLDSARWLSSTGAADLGWVEPDQVGAIDPDAVAAALDGSAVSVLSLMWANNELGAISPIRAIAHIAAERGVPIHTDAVQAVGSVAIDFADVAVDALSLSAHKFGGPQGVGALLIRRTTKATPLLHGGGQERDLRSGTVDVAGVVGLAVALRLAQQQRVEQSARLARLRAELIGLIETSLPEVVINGRGDGLETLPGLLSLSVPGCDGDAMLMLLDEAGIRVSTGAACTSGVPEPSHVVLATYGDEDRARSTLRISMGRTTTEADVRAFVTALPAVVTMARAASTRGVPGG